MDVAAPRAVLEYGWRVAEFCDVIVRSPVSGKHESIPSGHSPLQPAAGAMKALVIAEPAEIRLA